MHCIGTTGEDLFVSWLCQGSALSLVIFPMAKVKEHGSHTTCFLYMTVNPVRSLVVSGAADETVRSWETNVD